MKKTILFVVLLLASLAAAEVVQVSVVGEGSPKQTAQSILSASEDPATLRLVFEDGQILEVTGTKADAQLFLDGGIDELEYLGKLQAAPITRGPPDVPGLCEPKKGESCLTAPECVCYSSQTCQPDSSSADVRGCVENTPPLNAHIEDGEYVCDQEYVWNGDVSGCVLPIQCPEGQMELEGACHSTAPDSSGDFCLLIFGFLLLASPFVGLLVLVLIAAAVIILLKKRKK